MHHASCIIHCCTRQDKINAFLNLFCIEYEKYLKNFIIDQIFSINNKDVYEFDNFIEKIVFRQMMYEVNYNKQ
jgi:hypothetical protein